MSFHKDYVSEEINPQIATLGMLVYIHFYYISEHLGDWDRGNMNILRIGAEMTSGEPSGRPGWARVIYVLRSQVYHPPNR